jgi:hypothetical protein
MSAGRRTPQEQLKWCVWWVGGSRRAENRIRESRSYRSNGFTRYAKAASRFAFSG